MNPTSAIPPDIQKRIDAWLHGPYDAQTKKEIQHLQQTDPSALTDAFCTGLAFGTGGMRGLMGVGTNRLNIYTIQMATQGLVNYLIQQKKDAHLYRNNLKDREFGKEGPQNLHSKRGTIAERQGPSENANSEVNPTQLKTDPSSYFGISAVIGFDSRHHSEEFAWYAARVLAGNNIRVYLLSELRPTPFVSFACRTKKADAAIMITASHNPKEYNGYKVYWSDGAQVVHPHDSGIVEEAQKIQGIEEVTLAEKDSPLITVLTDELDSAFLDAIRPLQHFSKENKKDGHLLKIAYTPLHGTGITLTPRALADWGFSSVYCVEEQSKPDGNFPTVPFPNPEYKQALELGIALLMRDSCDILLANDPDADRMGVVARHHAAPVILNGNEVAALCTAFLCAQNKLPSNGAFVTTIVSTELIRTIAAAHHLACFEVLTGFKYIGEKIHEWESKTPSYHFIFGAEESYGYLIGMHARDKDAISASCLLAEIALHAKSSGKTLIDLLHAIYSKYGVFREKQASVQFKPNQEQMHKMQQLMDALRKNPPEEIAGIAVLLIEDYESGIRRHIDSNKTEKLTLPQSDVLLLRLSDQSRIVIRPSGTEPKIKIYASTRQPSHPSIESTITECDARLDTLLNAVTHLLS